MRLLVLGGTRFLGRGIVDAALAAGDQVTTFTRGASGEPPPGVDALHGDRNRPDGMDVLRGREWDAVVDTSGYVPVVVGRGAKLLADSAGHYVFVSSVNAYPSWPEQPVRADTPVHDCGPDAGAEDGSFEVEQYGAYKVGSERAVDRHFAGRSVHLRSGLIVGPHDPSGRFPYWVRRLDRGGEVLAPGDPDRELRVVDARDLGAFAVECARHHVTGAFPATGPAGQTTFGELLGGMEAGPDTRLTWVADDFLVEHGVQPWSELPLWIPVDGGAGVWDQDTTAAEQAGLRCRPVRQTAADTLTWLRAGGTEGEVAPIKAPRTTPAGMTPEREAELLAAWHGR